MSVSVTKQNSAPVYGIDFYSDEFIADPYMHYRAMRDLGAAVWLAKNECFAITRFADVRDALRNPGVFISGRGVMMNDPVNQQAAGSSTLNTDDPKHAELRQLIGKPLSPAALAPLRDTVRSAADALVDKLVARGEFDGIADFAHYLPLLLVSRLVGLPEDGREQMLEWATGIFNSMGNLNHRFQQGVIAHDAARRYMSRIEPANLLPDSWGARLFSLVDDGKITEELARSMLFDYVAPALDTTINGTSATLWSLGSHPDQWALVRQDPKLLPAAIEEALRLEAPVRAFSRYVAADADVDGIVIPAGSRVLIVYASANRDERYWPDAERYDIRRKAPQEHLSFGTGIHMCAGMHLAKLEMRCLFEALAKRVVRFEVGPPHREAHNVVRGISSMNVTITEAA